MNDFDQLLGELATLTKAATADSKVMAAAREGRSSDEREGENQRTTFFHIPLL